MKPRDVFGIILRTIAVYFSVWGAWNSLAGIKFLPITIVAAFSRRENTYNSLGYFVYGLPALIGGLLILRFAERLVGFTYREKTPPSLPTSSDSPPVVVGDKA